MEFHLNRSPAGSNTFDSAFENDSSLSLDVSRFKRRRTSIEQPRDQQRTAFSNFLEQENTKLQLKLKRRDEDISKLEEEISELKEKNKEIRKLKAEIRQLKAENKEIMEFKAHNMHLNERLKKQSSAMTTLKTMYDEKCGDLEQLSRRGAGDSYRGRVIQYDQKMSMRGRDKAQLQEQRLKEREKETGALRQENEKLRKENQELRQEHSDPSNSNLPQKQDQTPLIKEIKDLKSKNTRFVDLIQQYRLGVNRLLGYRIRVFKNERGFLWKLQSVFTQLDKKCAWIEIQECSDKAGALSLMPSDAIQQEPPSDEANNCLRSQGYQLFFAQMSLDLWSMRTRY